MTDKKPTINLQVPLEIPVEAVEKELATLWRHAAEQQGENAIVRACSSNLIALARDRREAESLPGILAKVAEQYPCRSIIAYREGTNDRAGCSDGPHMHAWISTHCTLPFSRGPQICSEILTVAAYGDAAHDLHNTLLSLLIPDLPVFIYWRSFITAEQDLVERLARFSDVLVVDSHVSKDDPRNRDRLLELLTSPPGPVAVRDLNWARLTAWRDLIAQFFDAPRARPLVREISEVEICRAIIPGSIPTRTLLLTGWLATRLNWKRISAARTGDEWSSRWMSSGGEVLARFLPEMAGSEQEPGITAVRLRTRQGTTLSVTSQKGASCMTASAAGHDYNLVHSVSQEPSDEASLLIQELSLAGEDLVFKEGLAEALALEKSFQTHAVT